MIALKWPLVIPATLLLYILIIITFPFSSVLATVLLFALIAFWSRFPGVGLPSPFFLLYVTDFVDLFSIIIAINLGGPAGALFSIVTNLYSRACGVWPDWGGVISDSIAQALACLVIPFLHVAFGGNIITSMIIYTVVRIIFIIPLDRLAFYQVPLPQYIAEMAIGGGALFGVNILYASLFGNFFNDLLERGMQFSWPLFIFATIVISIGFFIMNSRTEKSKRISLTKIFVRIFAPKKKHKKFHHLPNIESKPMEQIYKNDNIRKP